MTFIDTSRLDTKEPREGWRGQFFHSANMTFAYYTIQAGSLIHEHHHPNDEVWNVIEGRVAITVDGETDVAGPGCAVVVPPDVTHSLRAITDSRVIVVDYPSRRSIGGEDL